jgi:hypothetical protein
MQLQKERQCRAHLPKSGRDRMALRSVGRARRLAEAVALAIHLKKCACGGPRDRGRTGGHCGLRRPPTSWDRHYPPGRLDSHGVSRPGNPKSRLRGTSGRGTRVANVVAMSSAAGCLDSPGVDVLGHARQLIVNPRRLEPSEVFDHAKLKRPSRGHSPHRPRPRGTSLLQSL